MAAADGEQVVIDFTQIWYSEPGEYEYIVIENAGSDETIAYDTTTYRVFVSVTADADGTLTAEASYPDGTPSFVNEYTPDDEPGDDPGDDPGDTPGGDEPGDDPTDPGTDPGGSTGGKDPEKEQISETGDASVATGALAAMVAAGAGLAGVGCCRRPSLEEGEGLRATFWPGVCEI